MVTIATPTLYMPTIRKAAKRFGPLPGRLDRLGRGPEDYVSMLMWRAAQAQEKSATLPAGEQKLYVQKSVWNQARNMRRDAARQPAMSSVPEDCLDPVDPIAVLEARVDLQLLRMRLKAPEWRMLTVAAYHEGSAQAAYRHGVYEMGLTTFVKRIRALRAKANKLRGELLAPDSSTGYKGPQMMWTDKTDAEIQAKFVCYGQLWDGAVAPVCKDDCEVSSRCLDYVIQTMPTKLERVGKKVADVTREEVQRLLTCKPGSADVVLGRLLAGGMRTAATAQVLPIEKPEEEDQDRAVVDGVVAPQKKKKPRAKKKVPEIAFAEAVIEDPVSPKIAKSKKTKGSWSEGTHADRVEKERKHPLIGQIAVGQTLSRTYKDNAYDVTRTEDGWVYESRKYPTLYQVTAEITQPREYPAQIRDGQRPAGSKKTSAWSAPRFWKLKSLLGG